MEDTGSSSEASSSTVAEGQWGTTSWTSWKVLRSLLRNGMSDLERLGVLEALGSCKSVRSVDTRDLEYCQLSVLEWDVLLRPLKSSPTLEEIIIELDFDQPGNVWCNPSDYWTEVLENVPVLKKLNIMDKTDEGGLCGRLSLFLAPISQGLQRNLNPSVEELRIQFRWDGYERSSLTLLQVAYMVRSSRSLRKLGLENIPYLEEIEVGALLNALKQSSSLRILEINGAKREGMAKVLLQAITGVDSNLSLKELLLREMPFEGLGFVLPHLLKANISHVKLVYSGYYFQTYPWREIGHALLEPTSLQMFTVEIRPSRDLLSNKWAEELLEASQQSPLLSFSLHIGWWYVPNFINSIIAHLGLPHMRNVQLTYTFPTNQLPFLDRVMNTLNRNQDVEEFTCEFGMSGLGYDRADPGGWKRLIFGKLGDNSSIKALTVLTSHSQQVLASQGIFEQVMKLLHRNFSLQRIYVGEWMSSAWMSEGKLALVEEALNRNARHSQFMSVVRKAGLEFSAIKAGRILLSGSPYAGKTRLTKTMLKVARTWGSGRDSWSTKLRRSIISFQESKLPRTKGIEISTLWDYDEMKVAVWDLGGQWIFRALQDLLFPVAGQACIYLFVFNPFEIVKGKRCLKADLPLAFRTELKSWLRFIASNSPVIADLPPQMMVVFSHKDVMHHHERDLQWARSIILQLHSTFKRKVDLSLQSEDLHFVDCFDSEDVRSVLESIFQRMGSLLGKLVGKNFVPSPGIELTSVFASKPSKVRKSPIWTSDALYEFFIHEIDGLRHLNLQIEREKTILEALAVHLHEVGSIIRVPDSKLVVVDPNWMTEKFLGELINHGHDFRVETPRIPQKYRNCSSHDGFIDLHNFNCILSSLVDSYKLEGMEVHQDQLEKLLVKLNLCFKLDDMDGNRRYFMPAICGGNEEKLPVTKLQWTLKGDNGSQDFGFRLQCYDRETTCLTKSFFPTFQIKLRNILVQELKVNSANVRCSPGLMKIWEDGHEIFVESDELGEDHIDIMVRTQQCKEIAVKFVEQKIIQLLREFSASGMGNAGVSLTQHILRTECVTKLISRDHKNDDQVISVSELRMKIVKNAKEKLRAKLDEQKQVGTKIGEIPFTMWFDSMIESTLGYVHWWPEINHPGHEVYLPRSPEVVRELLPEKVLEEIREEVQTMTSNFKHTMSCSRERTLEDQVIQLSDTIYEIYAPVGGDPCVELVFVHGILEHQYDEKPYPHTWNKRNSTEECWLNTWLITKSQIDLTRARIIIVSYDCSVQKTDSSGNIDSFQVAENLARSLITFANVGQHTCPVVLVGHGIGGLVLKELCVYVSRNVEMRDSVNFLGKVRGIFFYSTPHLDLSSKLGDYNLSKSSSYEIQKGKMMKTIELWNEHNTRTHFFFGKLCQKYGWRTQGVGESDQTKVFLFQDNETVIQEIKVEEASARSSLDEFFVVPNTNHFTICRPESTKSDSFLALVLFIKCLLSA